MADFESIKDHHDLMNAFHGLIQSIILHERGVDQTGNIDYLKAEIAHFLRLQSAQKGLYVEGKKSAIHPFASYNPTKQKG